jgi:hypothetical protein
VEYEAWLQAREKRKAQIKELYLQGKSQHHIARIIGISQPGVRKHLVSMRLLPPTSKETLAPDGSPGIPLVLSIKEGEFIKMGTPDGYSFLRNGIEIARCKHCRGFSSQGDQDKYIVAMPVVQVRLVPVERTKGKK